MIKIMMNLVLSISMISSAFGLSHTEKDRFVRDKMIRNMELASVWMIEEGVNVYSKSGKEGLEDKLFEWGVQLWVDPWVEEDPYLAQFRIKGRGINYTIHNLYREKIGNSYYEYWLNKIVPSNWSGETQRSVFFITKTSDIYGFRKIIKRSDQFIENYRLINGIEFILTTTNKRILYILSAWNFPENYKNSELKNVIVDFDDETGELVFKY